MRLLSLLCAGLVLTAGAHAAGPDSVARANRSLWPDPIASNAGFDRASRAELLAFGHALAATETLDDAAWLARLHIKQVDAAHLAHMRQVYWERIARNYAIAAAHCAATEPFCVAARDAAAFKQASAAFDLSADARYGAWFADASAFHRTYLDELLRLAALFPRISSEIDTFNANEFTGSDLPDRQFFLTFDDGPSPDGGNTDKLLALLRQAHLQGTFFVLGENLKARANHAETLYDGMCVGMHGWEHKSHASWPQWQDSVERTTALAKERLPDEFVPLFRPPYGQRKADSQAYFAAQQLGIALWNIDSQDWNNSVSGAEVGQRVLTLMLLWRHGIILFHDIHSKAQVAVPYLVAQLQGSDATWMSCRSLPGAGKTATAQ